MLKLMPSLREKKRYLVYEIISKNKISNATKEINNTLLKFLGVLGMGRAGIIMLDYKNNKGIIKVNNKYVDEVRGGLMMINTLEDKQVILKTINVSGMLNKARDMI